MIRFDEEGAAILGGAQGVAKARETGGLVLVHNVGNKTLTEEGKT